MRAAIGLFLVAVIFVSSGCTRNQCRCGGHHGGGMGGNLSAARQAGFPSPVARLPHGYMEQQMAGPAGPASPTTAYPYYTLRAPRDFLSANPPSIGP